MATRLIVLLSLALAGLADAASLPKEKDEKVVVCYYGSWAVYKPGAGKFDVEDIDPFICTHVIYSFAGLTDSGVMISLDPRNDLYDNNGKGAFERFTSLKEINPDLKTLLAIGGWAEGSANYSKMVSTAEGRENFLVKAVDFLLEYQFDGLDFDWEYPGLRGGGPNDKENFVALLSEMRPMFDENGLMMTAAVGAGKSTIDEAYDIPVLGKYLDHIHVMCYDYHGGWENFTGHNSPLYRGPQDKGIYEYFNTNFTMHYWIQNGAPKEKLVLGIPLYGKSYTLDDENQSGFYAPASKPGLFGGLGYDEICVELKTNRSDWKTTRDPYYMAPYAVNGNQWICYDDVESVNTKARYAADLGLKGAMVWSIESDDFHGGCHGQKFPLMHAIRDGLNGHVHATEPDMQTTEATETDPTEDTEIETTTMTMECPNPPPADLCKNEGRNAYSKECQLFHRCPLDTFTEFEVVLMS